MSEQMFVYILFGFIFGVFIFLFFSIWLTNYLKKSKCYLCKTKTTPLSTHRTYGYHIDCVRICLENPDLHNSFQIRMAHSITLEIERNERRRRDDRELCSTALTILNRNNNNKVEKVKEEKKVKSVEEKVKITKRTSEKKRRIRLRK